MEVEEFRGVLRVRVWWRKKRDFSFGEVRKKVG